MWPLKFHVVVRTSPTPPTKKPAQLAPVFSQRLMGRKGFWFFIRLVQTDVFLCKPKERKGTNSCDSKTGLWLFLFREESVVACVSRALTGLYTFRFSFRHHHGPADHALVLIFIVPIFSSYFCIFRFPITPECTNSFIVNI